METVDFGNGWEVEHLNWKESVVYHNGEEVRKFAGKETSWQEAERFASDKSLSEAYR